MNEIFWLKESVRVKKILKNETNSAILKRAKNIKLLAMDVDGVLTAGEIIILNSGEELKIWSVKDRMGFALLKESGLPIKLAWITARESHQVKKRAKEIGIHFLIQKCGDKWKALAKCAKKLQISTRQIAFIGDDFVDLHTLKTVGLAICPPESPELLKKVCHYQTKSSAGKGVVREVIELLIKAQGRWEKAMSKFAVVFLFFLSFLGCTSSQKPLADFSEKPDQWVEKFTITETLSGVPVWVLNSENAQVYNKQRKVNLENVRIEFMNAPPAQRKRSKESLLLAKKALTLAARLSAPKGEVKMDNHDLLAWGGVEVQSEDGTKLFSERLHYSTNQQKIVTESPVKVVRRDSTLIGEGLEASPDLSTIKIFRHRAEIYPKQVQLK